MVQPHESPTSAPGALVLTSRKCMRGGHQSQGLPARLYYSRIWLYRSYWVELIGEGMTATDPPYPEVVMLFVGYRKVLAVPLNLPVLIRSEQSA